MAEHCAEYIRFRVLASASAYKNHSKSQCGGASL